MAELKCHGGENSPPISDYEMIYYLKVIIEDVMIENRIYLDDDDRADAVEIIYPMIAHIVFNTFGYIRKDEKKLVDLITYLVTNLS